MKDKVLIATVLISLFILLVFSNKTYTAYESAIDDEINVSIAEWKILIDDQNIATTTESIALSNITWEGEHISDNKVAPGSKGEVKITINPTSTQVAIKYNITYEDHISNPDCLLTVTSIYLEDEELEKVSDNSYSGIITLDQIKEKTTKTLVINVEWINDEDNNEIDSQIGLDESTPNYLELVFTASQYTGD